MIFYNFSFQSLISGAFGTVKALAATFSGSSGSGGDPHKKPGMMMMT